MYRILRLLVNETTSNQNSTTNQQPTIRVDLPESVDEQSKENKGISEGSVEGQDESDDFVILDTHLWLILWLT